MNKKVYIPMIITALLGFITLFLIPFQVKSMVRGVNYTRIEASTIPRFLALMIIGLSFLEIFVQKKKDKEENNSQPKTKKTDENLYCSKAPKTKKEDIIRIVITIILMLLWFPLVSYLGFVVTTTLLLIGIMFTMGNKNLIQILSVPIITTFILRYVFNVLVGITLPTGGLFFN